MARRIKIVRRKKPEILRMPKTKISHPSYGAGDQMTGRTYWCMWCYAEKPPKQGRPAKCSMCGHFGETSTPQKKITHVYLEDNPIFLEESC